MTSLTVLLVLLPLPILGGSTLFGFSLVMIIGVIFGTSLLSILLASFTILSPEARKKSRRRLTK